MLCLRLIAIRILAVATLTVATPAFTALAQTDATSPGTTPPASPAAIQEPSTAECAAFNEWSWAYFVLLADPIVAFYEAEIVSSTEASDPAAIDLPATTAREVAAQIDAFIQELSALESPAVAQPFRAAAIAQFTAFAADLIQYADAVEGGSDPGQALTAFATDPERTRLATEYSTLLDAMQAACYIGVDEDITAARELAALAEAAAGAQEAAEVPAVAREANDALLAFLADFAPAANTYAERVGAGEDHLDVSNELIGAFRPSAIAASAPIQRLLEGCGVEVGVTNIEPVPPVSAQECEQVFAWYEATAARFVDLNAAIDRYHFLLVEYGIALPGGHGSVDLDVALTEGEAATPTAAATAGATPAASPAASPAATPRYSAEECAGFFAAHEENQERGAELQVAYNEARFPDVPPTALDLEPAIAREIADLIDRRELTTEGAPADYQAFVDALLASDDAFADRLREYADAVEAGAGPDEAILAVFDDPEGDAELAEGVARFFEIDEACRTDAEVAASNRDLATLVEAAAGAQEAAEVPAVAQEANDALVAFLEAFGPALIDYADAVEAGANRLDAQVAGLTAIRPIATTADEFIRDLLERCGIAVGVTESDDGIPPLSAAECDQVFAWYEATAGHLAAFNAVSREHATNLGEVGIALPGNLGSVDLDTILGQDGTATPATGATPAATRQLSAEACAQVEPTHFEEQIIGSNLQVAFNEAGLGVVVGEFDPAAVDLDPAVARELAMLISETARALDDIEVPDFYQEANDAFVAADDAFAAGLNDYAAAVEAGADPDAELNAMFAELTPVLAAAPGPIDELRAICNLPQFDTDIDRELAGLLDIAAREQVAADVPEVAREANDALVAFLEAFAVGERQFAGRVDAGEEPASVSTELGEAVEPSAIAADTLIRELLERCGVSVGVASIDAGETSRHSEQECAEIFAWYAATADRLADVNATLRKALIPLPQVGIALPGYLGSVDLGALEAPTAPTDTAAASPVAEGSEPSTPESGAIVTMSLAATPSGGTPTGALPPPAARPI